MNKTIGIIGGGNMGGAIIGGVHKDFKVVVCEQDTKRAARLKKAYEVATGDLKTVAQRCQVLILAVKPQNFDELLTELMGLISKDTLVISIAAGITCLYIEKRLKIRQRVVRTMPNLPAQVKEGMTGICKGRFATKADLDLTCRIFGLIGKTALVTEQQMNAITAISGSGPAYVFHFIEVFSKAAVALGVKEDTAQRLILQTLKGSIKLFEQENQKASVLRERVTSKKGTTEAALKVFQKNKYEKIFKEALKAAVKRAKELSRS